MLLALLTYKWSTTLILKINLYQKAWRLLFKSQGFAQQAFKPMPRTAMPCFNPEIQQGHWWSVSLSFFPGNGYQLPALVLHSSGHTAGSISFSRTSAFLCAQQKPSSQFQLQLRGSAHFCIVHFESTAGHWKLSKPSSNLTCQGNILCSSKSSDNALQTPTRNTLRLFSLFHLLHGFNQTGLCIFKWEPTANTGIPFSTFLFLLTPRIQVTLHRSLLSHIRWAWFQCKTHPQFSYQLSPRCSQLGVSQVFRNIPWEKKPH